ncbi:hypothetical protein LCGC14_0692160 [marine sediment metagenome]|uniref:Uncharacterized protein n=1 Tax=marine sediment metagenome TaxID=412755 RepID=A0A0F9T6C4_9ZZZZ
MKAEDTEKYKKELHVIGKKINDFGAEYSRCSLDKKRALPDIVELTKLVFEIAFKAGVDHECLGWMNADTSTQLGKAKREGIKEVVEELSIVFITGGSAKQQAEEVFKILEKWQAKFKEWGI